MFYCTFELVVVFNSAPDFELSTQPLAQSRHSRSTEAVNVQQDFVYLVPPLPSQNLAMARSIPSFLLSITLLSFSDWLSLLTPWPFLRDDST